MLKKKVIILGLFFVLAMFLLPGLAWGQGVDLGVDEARNIGLPGDKNSDPRVIIVKVIRVALGFLGIIAVAIFLYGGWLWMTSGGNEEKIGKAKKTLINAIIGIIIIMSAFIIVNFILNMLEGGDGIGSGPPTSRPPSSGGGIGAIGACSVETVYPEDGQQDVPRNTAIMVSFKEAVDLSTVQLEGSNYIDTESVQIYQTNNPDVLITDVQASITSDNMTIILSPDDYLGSPSGFIWYTVHLSNINKLNPTGTNPSIFSNCYNDFLEWQFEVSNRIDLTPPQIVSVFPNPDNEQDTIIEQGLAQAEGSITVTGTPNTYNDASVTVNKSPTDALWSDATATISGICSESRDMVVSSTGNSIQIYEGSTLLGAGTINGNTATFTLCNLTLTLTEGDYISNYSRSNCAWDITFTPMQAADNLRVGNNSYVFGDGNNEIGVGATTGATAANIANILSDHPDVEVDYDPGTSEVDLIARVAGSDGDNITLTSTADSEVITISDNGMTGGQDSLDDIDENDEPDEYRNAAIKITFNEAINPVSVTGHSIDDNPYISINIAGGSEIAGTFVITNSYRTLEFIPDDLCGINACGEDIYCLPGGVNIRLVLLAGLLEDCGDDNCASKSPYNNCVGGVCRNTDGENYPVSAKPPQGIMDAQLNSLDGNMDGDADGPVSEYDLNNPNSENGDNVEWSFWTLDDLDLTPPTIISISPDYSDAGVLLNAPITINFSKLMLASSLATGERTITAQEQTITHKLINLWSFTGSPIGYWITSQDMAGDGNPADLSVPDDDYTQAEIRHSMFSDATSYRVQVGSGVRDIYQNCFQPSSGPGCTGGLSCCNGVASGGSSCE